MFLLVFWLCFLRQVAQAEVIWNLPDISSQQGQILHKGIEGTVTLPFAGSIGRGVLPIFVELEHNGKDEVEVELTLGQASKQIFKQVLILKPGDKKSYEWEIPLKQDQYYVYGSVSIDGKTVENLSFSFDTFHPEYFRSSFRSPPRLILSQMPSQKAYPEWFAASQLHNEMNTGAKFLSDDHYLPLNHSGYSTLFTVVWFIDDVAIEPRKRKALAHWVKNGGHLIVVGDTDKLQGMQEFSSWQEERFKKEAPITNSIVGDAFSSGMVSLNSYTKEDYHKVMALSGIELKKHTQWKMGFGLLTTVSARVSLEQAYQLQMNFLNNKTGMYHSDNVTPFDLPKYIESDYSRGIWNSVTIHELKNSWEELELAPEWVIVLLSYLFLMLVGPVNLIIAMRRNRMILLVSTPLTAIFCVAVVFGVNLILHTKSVRGISIHRTLFDQRATEVISTEQRLFFLSRKLSKELQPTASSTLVPVSHNYGRTDYKLEVVENEQIYRRYADYREVSAHWGWYQTTHRVKLSIEANTVKNNFDFDIEEIYYSDSAGKLWRAKNIGAGKSASLDEFSSPFKLTHWQPEALPSFNPLWETLPKETYILRTRDIGFGLKDEISEKISKKDQIIYGIL